MKELPKVVYKTMLNFSEKLDSVIGSEISIAKLNAFLTISLSIWNSCLKKIYLGICHSRKKKKLDFLRSIWSRRFDWDSTKCGQSPLDKVYRSNSGLINLVIYYHWVSLIQHVWFFSFYLWLSKVKVKPVFLFIIIIFFKSNLQTKGNKNLKFGRNLR